MSSVKIALGSGLALLATAIVVVLSGSPVALAGSNMSVRNSIGVTHSKVEACQPNGVLPAKISAIRLNVLAANGPRVTVKLLSGGRVVARGQRGSGWTGASVTVPLKPLPSAISGVTLCFTLYSNRYELNQFLGEIASGSRSASGPTGKLGGRLAVEYLRSNRSSWWSLAPEIARRMGIGGYGGSVLSALLVLIAMGGVVVLCSRTLMRELG